MIGYIFLPLGPKKEHYSFYNVLFFENKPINLKYKNKLNKKVVFKKINQPKRIKK